MPLKDLLNALTANLAARYASSAFMDSYISDAILLAYAGTLVSQWTELFPKTRGLHPAARLHARLLATPRWALIAAVAVQIVWQVRIALPVLAIAVGSAVCVWVFSACFCWLCGWAVVCYELARVAYARFGPSKSPIAARLESNLQKLTTLATKEDMADALASARVGKGHFAASAVLRQELDAAWLKYMQETDEVVFIAARYPLGWHLLYGLFLTPVGVVTLDSPWDWRWWHLELSSPDDAALDAMSNPITDRHAVWDFLGTAAAVLVQSRSAGQDIAEAMKPLVAHLQELQALEHAAAAERLSHAAILEAVLDWKDRRDETRVRMAQRAK
ncbi:hypothetical protein JCM10213v2_005619 [Rhodosporidiobolus nylandii]